MAKTDITPVEFVETTSTNLSTVQENHPGAFIHVNDTNGDDQLYIGDDQVTDKFNVGDSNPNHPTRKVGGLNASTIGTLKNKTMSEILMDILRPDVVEPTVSDPASINISYSGSTLIEVGTSLPGKSGITSTVNDGSWSDGTPYAGGHGSVTLNMDPNSWGGTSVEGKYTISGGVEFTEGGIPKDNFGTEYPKYQGGTVNSNTITITSVRPIYINDGDDIIVMNKHVVNYIDGVELSVTIPPEIETPEPTKFKVQVPYQFTRFEVKKYNQLTGKYDINVPMIFVPGNTNMYIREDNTYTNTTHTQYKINLKK